MPSKPAPPGRSAAVEDYLEQILDLINTKGYARVADIAHGLKISQASVTNMVQRMDAEGLLKYEKYRGLVLTTAGETLARNIMQRHQLLTDFFACSGSARKSSIMMSKGWNTTSVLKHCMRSKLWCPSSNKTPD